MVIIKMTGFAILLISIAFNCKDVISGTIGYINFNGSINEPACSFKSDALAMNVICFQQNRQEPDIVSISKAGGFVEVNETVSVYSSRHSTNQSIMQIHITYK